MKSGVAALRALVLVATSQKIAIWPLLKKKNHMFVSKNKKTIVCKVVGNGKMHKSAEDGFMILKFSMSSALALPKKHPFWAI